MMKQKINPQQRFVIVPENELEELMINCFNLFQKHHTQASAKEYLEKEQWLDLSELCKYLPEKPAKPTVYSWVHNADIPFHKRGNGKKLYFLKSEIDSWLKEGRKKTVKELQVQSENDLLAKNKGGRL